ncbi:hypothetical protein EIP86_006653 [Pleurotus ostreatoroseus]|nr:hypothetical protein EIP86_006653 [Pleurotus ostreatoroseus]
MDTDPTQLSPHPNIPKTPTQDPSQHDEPLSSPARPVEHSTSDTSIIYTSPIPNKKKDPEGYHAVRMAKGQKKTLETLKKKKEEARHISPLYVIEEDYEPDKRGFEPPPLPALFPEPFASSEGLPPSDPDFPRWSSDEDDHLTREEILARILQDLINELAINHLCFGHLLDYLFDPDNKQGTVRYYGFFQDRDCVFRVLDNWIHWRNGAGRQLMDKWLLQYTSKKVSREGNIATKKGFLQSRTRVVDESFALDYDPVKLFAEVRASCPIMTTLLQAFATTGRQAAAMTVKRQQRKEKRIASAALTLLGERSQRNSYMKHVMGLYLYASGAQRQVISVCSSLEVSSSYQTIAGTKKYAALEASDDIADHAVSM